MHIELTEMLCCTEPHGEAPLVLSTGEMVGRMVRSGILGCPICRREFPIVKGVVQFSGRGMRDAGSVSTDDAPHLVSRIAHPVDAGTLQALLDLSGPGGYVVLLGTAARHAIGLAAVMGGIHFVGVNAPGDLEELPILSLLECDAMIPLRKTMARAVVAGRDRLDAAWLSEARRVLLPGRRLVLESDRAVPPDGIARLALGDGLFVGERR